jgi:hypothetical protein
VLGDRGFQRLGVADLMPAVGEDLGQVRPDHGGVLGDDDPHPGLPAGVRRQFQVCGRGHSAHALRTTRHG